MLVIASLSAGGSERVLSTMANHWADAGRKVTFVTLSDGSDDHYALDPRVRRIALGAAGQSKNKAIALVRNLRRVARLRKVIGGPASPVVISFGEATNVLTLLAGIGTGARSIVSERIDPRHHPLRPPWGILRRLSYRRANRLVVQTAAVGPWASALVGDRYSVIGNPIRDPGPIADGNMRDATAPTILAVGRLVHQKGFDILLRGFAHIAAEFPDWNLAILGEGEERTSLSMLSHDLGIADRVSMPGVVRDPERFMRSSDLFVMSSRYEGFPNVLLEAMTNGMPVISTDCPSGPDEIVRSGVDGLLVPVDDANALGQAMRRLMGDASLRESLGKEAPSVHEQFGLTTIMDKWDRLVDGDPS